MTRSAQVLLEDILESIRQVEEYVAEATQEDFVARPMVQDAVLRRLEIIGEAVKGLPGQLRDKYPRVPWRQIAGARDILMHEYFRVDLELAWQMVTTNLPELKTSVTEILRDIESTGDKDE